MANLTKTYTWNNLPAISQVHIPTMFANSKRRFMAWSKRNIRNWYGAEYLQFGAYSSDRIIACLSKRKLVSMFLFSYMWMIWLSPGGNDEGEVAKLRAELSKRFEIQGWKEALSLAWRWKIRRMELVSKRAEKLIDKLGMKDVSILRLMRLRRGDGKVLPDPREFRAIVGSLIYLTITSKTDAFEVGLVSRFMPSPSASTGIL